MSESEKHKRTRREFARDVALAAATAAAIPASVLAQTEKAAKPLKPPEQPVSQEMKELSSAARMEVEQNYNGLMNRYGNRFSEEQKKDIHRLLVQQQKSIEAVRAFPLTNGDEPGLVLHLDSKKG